jgi:DNA sulfur modification protein DndD
MKLLSIQFCNFRQFYGKTTTIKLAINDQNTTIIHGNNGSGKTTILNGFTWVLYDKFTPAFAAPDFLINKRAINEVNLGASVECWVEIFFEHEEKTYQLKRQCYAHRDVNDKINHSKSQLFMLIAGDDGRWYHPLEHPDDIISRILPETLHEYFFFDGERIEHRFRNSKQNKIAEDTKELLGVKVLDRAIEHLKNAKKNLQKELNNIGDLEIKQFLKQEKILEERQEKILLRQEEIIGELENFEIIKQSLSSRLLELGSAKELQQLKIEIELQEKNTINDLIATKNELKNLISRQGYTVFLTPLVSKFSSYFQEMRDKGELPSGIKQKFVEELLTRKTCICGTELITGTIPHQNVENWLNKAGIANVEEAAIRLESQVNTWEKQLTELWETIDNHQLKVAEKRSSLSHLENQLDELKNKLRHYPDENIQELQTRLDSVEQSIRGITLEQGSNIQQLENISLEIKAISKKIAQHKLKEEKQNLVQKRIKITGECIETIIEVRSRLEKQFRLSLEQKIQEIFNTISFTPYQARLNQNYELNLMENSSGIALPVAASTGENQILSLSLIGAIIARVREWSKKNTLMGPDSSTFPIVMDSPFGSLDEIYRRQVAKSIPQLANQLVILVTKTQWRKEVEEEITPHISKEYVLLYHSPKEDCEEDFININGISYPLVKYEADGFEYTEIIEV